MKTRNEHGTLTGRKLIRNEVMDGSAFTVRYIALDEELQRIEYMENWLSSVFPNYMFSRAPGVSVDALVSVPEYDGLKCRRYYGYDRTPSEIGCYLAHRKCWKSCAELGLPMLVLEGDVSPRFPEDLPRQLYNLVSLANTFDIIRLHGVFPENERIFRKIAAVSPGGTMVQSLGDIMGSAAYFLTPSAAAELLRSSETIYHPVDVFLGATWIHKQRLRTLKPHPFFTLDVPSTIGVRRRPIQNISARLKIELFRVRDDIRRLTYLPWHFFR